MVVQPSASDAICSVAVAHLVQEGGHVVAQVHLQAKTQHVQHNHSPGLRSGKRSRTSRECPFLGVKVLNLGRTMSWMHVAHDNAAWLTTQSHAVEIFLR